MAYFWITLLPFAALFALLVPLRRPAYEAAPLAYLITLAIALLVWEVSGEVVAASLLDALVVFVEVLLIVSQALLVLNVTIETGHMDAIQSLIGSVSRDQRGLALLLGWGLVGFIEGIAKSLGRVAYAFVPFAVMVIALILSRTVMPLREMLQSVSLSFDEFRGIELSQSMTPLYTPYFYFALALITALILFRVRRPVLGKAMVSTWRKLRAASVVLVFIIAMTQLLLLSEINAADLPSIPEVLGQGLARIFNDTYVLVSAFVGALGSFMTGSATVSNLLFGGLQVDTAKALSMAVPSLLALQLVGAAVGNMISLQNIAMAAGAAGLEAREGQVIRETVIPMLVVCLAVGLLFLSW